MAVESVSYIDDLNPNLPAGSDSKAEGDNHIRNIKLALKNTFPNIDGATNVTTAQLTDLGEKSWKPGDIKWQAHASWNSSHWLECNGQVVSQAAYPALYAAIGTTWNTGGEGSGNFRLPNLGDRYPRGRSNTYAVGSYLNQMLLTHGHTASASSSTTVSVQNSGALSMSGQTGGQSQSHSHGYYHFNDSGDLPGVAGAYPGYTAQLPGNHSYINSGPASNDHTHSVTVTGANHGHVATASTTTSVTVNNYVGGSENRPATAVLVALIKT